MFDQVNYHNCLVIIEQSVKVPVIASPLSRGSLDSLRKFVPRDIMPAHGRISRSTGGGRQLRATNGSSLFAVNCKLRARSGEHDADAQTGRRSSAGEHFRKGRRLHSPHVWNDSAPINLARRAPANAGGWQFAALPAETVVPEKRESSLDNAPSSPRLPYN